MSTEIATYNATAPAVSTSAIAFDPCTLQAMQQLAEAMATTRVTVPKHLAGSLGDCLAIVMQSAHPGTEATERSETRAVTGHIHPIHLIHPKNRDTEKNSPLNAHDTAAMDGEPCASAPPNEHETTVNRPIPPPPLSAPLAEHALWLDAIGADDLDRTEWLAQLGRETAACTAGGCP